MFETISPGNVGSVGDVLSGIRIKQSDPDMVPKYIDGGSIWGSNVGDGDKKAWSHLGVGGARVDQKSKKVRWNNNFQWQDLRAPDVLHEPYLAAIPQYSWDNKVAQVYNAKRTGNLFLPIPGPYVLSEGEVPRGGSEVRLTDYDIPTDIYQSEFIGLGKGVGRSRYARL